MGSALGVLKVAASRTGLSVDEYQDRISGGEKWCTACKEWHQRSSFAIDKSRADGLAASCRSARNERGRTVHVRRPMPTGRRYALARDGDQKQARGRVNHLVNVGLLPDPNDVPCVDCGHVWTVNERRHEYDHYLGYAAEHHEDVESVCTICHHARENARRGRAHGQNGN